MSRILLLVLSAALFLCPAAADKPANFEKVDPANNDYAQGAAKREKEEEAEVFKLRSLEEATDVMAVVWEELDKPAAAARIRAIAEAGNHPAELTPALAGFLKRVLVQLRLTAKEEFPGANLSALFAELDEWKEKEAEDGGGGALRAGVQRLEDMFEGKPRKKEVGEAAGGSGGGRGQKDEL
jgi:hypothetical protein